LSTIRLQLPQSYRKFDCPPRRPQLQKSFCLNRRHCLDFLRVVKQIKTDLIFVFRHISNPTLQDLLSVPPPKLTEVKDMPTGKPSASMKQSVILKASELSVFNGQRELPQSIFMITEF